MLNKWRHNIDFPVFLSGLNIHCINIGSEFLSAVCQIRSSVNKTPAPSVSAHHSIISPPCSPYSCAIGQGWAAPSWHQQLAVLAASGCVSGTVMIASVQLS